MEMCAFTYMRGRVPRTGLYKSARVRRLSSFVLRYLAPLAKLILSGRRHQLMIGPELLLMEHELERMGYSIYFDVPFEFPVEDDDTSDYFLLASRTEFKCDFCRGEIVRGSGRLIGPWTLRRNRRLAETCIVGLGGGEIGRAWIWKDWSHWHYCGTCVESLSVEHSDPLVPH
jgi:hypothetical protein